MGVDAKQVIGSKPWDSHEEMVTSLALQAALESPDRLRSMQPPNLFPQRRGMVNVPPTIEDVLNVNRFAPTWKQKRGNISGAPIMIQRAQQTDSSWAGSSRYSMRSLW